MALERAITAVGDFLEKLDPTDLSVAQRPDLHATIKVTRHVKSGKLDVHITQSASNGIEYIHYLLHLHKDKRSSLSGKGEIVYQDGTAGTEPQPLDQQRVEELVVEFGLTS